MSGSRTRAESENGAWAVFKQPLLPRPQDGEEARFRQPEEGYISMNTVWSENIQGIQTLFLSRRLRFDGLFFEQYENAFSLDRNRELKILEIGCGPGALAEALHRWYPKASITAIDRDSNFIAFAKANVPGAEFLEGDAARLPFEEGTFDVTISNTVHEHIEPGAFWGEQYRVLKPGGVCLCLSARKGLSCAAPCLKITKEEEAFWNSVPQENETEKYGVARYATSEAELPASMEKYGFLNVTADYAVINLTPDRPGYPAELAEAMLEAMRQTSLEAIQRCHAPGREQAINAVNEKFDERLRLYRAGVKQWDTSVSLTMIARGVK